MGKDSGHLDVGEGIFKTLGILIQWGGGWWVAYHVLPAFAGKSSELLVNSVITWSINKGAPNYIFPVVSVVAIGWAAIERRHRKREIVRLQAEMKALEGVRPPEQLVGASEQEETA